MKTFKNLNLYHIAKLSTDQFRNEFFDAEEQALLREPPPPPAQETISQREKRRTEELKQAGQISTEQRTKINEAAELLHIYAQTWSLLRFPPPEYQHDYKHAAPKNTKNWPHTQALKNLIALQEKSVNLCSNAQQDTIKKTAQEITHPESQAHTGTAPAAPSNDYPRTEAEIFSHLAIPGRALFDLVKEINAYKQKSTGKKKFPKLIKKFQSLAFPAYDFDTRGQFDLSALARTKAERDDYRRRAAEVQALAEQKQREKRLSERKEINWHLEAKGPPQSFAEKLINPEDPKPGIIGNNWTYKETAAAFQIFELTLLRLENESLSRIPLMSMRWLDSDALDDIYRDLTRLSHAPDHLIMGMNTERKHELIYAAWDVLDNRLNEAECTRLCPRTAADIRKFAEKNILDFETKELKQALLQETPIEDRLLWHPKDFFKNLINPEDPVSAYGTTNVETLGKAFHLLLISEALFSRNESKLPDVQPIFDHGHQLHDPKLQLAFDGMVNLLFEHAGRKAPMSPERRKECLGKAVDAVVDCLDEAEPYCPKTAEQIRGVVAALALERTAAKEAKAAALREMPLTGRSLLPRDLFLSALLDPEDQRTALKDPSVQTLGKAYQLLKLSELLALSDTSVKSIDPQELFDHTRTLYEPELQTAWQGTFTIFQGCTGDAAMPTRNEIKSIFRTCQACVMYELDEVGNACPKTSEAIKADIVNNSPEKLLSKVTTPHLSL